MRTVIRNGNLILETGIVEGDLLIEDGRIAVVGESVESQPGDEVVDATDQYVMPGMVDAHTHFALRSGDYLTVDDFTTGTRSAACGGVTTVIDYATQLTGESLLETIRKRREQADGNVCIDYALHGIVVDLEHGQRDELPELVEAGIPSVKVYTTYREAQFFADDLTLLQLLERSQEIGLLVTVHAENDAIVEGTKAELTRRGLTSLEHHGESRPPIAETEAVNRVIFFAQSTQSPVYFVHLSTPDAVQLTVDARESGTSVIAESCPHYLVLDDSVFNSDRPEEFICSPPIRPARMADRMENLLTQGKIHVVASDHCGYSLAQKREATSINDAPQGLPGVETSLPVLYSTFVAQGNLPLERLVTVLSTNPAKVYGLYPEKGTLSVGSDADVVIYDPKGEDILKNSDLHGAEGVYTPYAGRTLYGRVAMTISKGEIVYRDGTFIGKPGYGRFVPGKPFDPAVVADL